MTIYHLSRTVSKCLINGISVTAILVQVFVLFQTAGSTELIDNDLLLEDLLAQSAMNAKNEEKSKSDAKEESAT